MKTFSSGLIEQKNKLNSREPWLVAIELETPGGTEYLINNNEALDWDGQTFSPYFFTFDTIPGKSSGELPEVAVSVFNTAEMQEYIGENNGLIGYECIVNLVYATKTAGTWSIPGTRSTHPLRYKFKIIDCSPSRDTISFIVGVKNYMMRSIPACLYHKDWCTYAFKGDRCWMKGLTTALGDCDHTYQDCSAYYVEQERPDTGIGFGGEPNIGKGSYVY